MVDSGVLPRTQHVEQVEALLRESPVVGLLGPRQVGKTTLARMVAARSPQATLYDLEDPEDEARLSVPKLALASHSGLVVLDEIQRRPDLFDILRVLSDRSSRPATFLVLGSASPELLRRASESLAGRIAHYDLAGLGLDEVSAGSLEALWLRGGFPRSFLARSEAESYRWRGDFLRSFVERDLPALGLRLAPDAIRRFWTMVAHYHGQVWNGAELARALAVSEGTVRHYLDILVGTWLVHRIEPWHGNPGKRHVKSPKVYIADSGLLHRLLQLEGRDDLLGHPKVGASFEGFALSAVLQQLGARRDEAWFWGLHSGAELDLLVVRGQQRLGFEFKLSEAPKPSRSMHAALANLGLARLDVVHLGRSTFPLGEGLRALSIHRLADDLPPLLGSA